MKPITTRTWSTPLIIGCSLVVAVSGIMLFFHLGEELVKSMHEWLGLLFAAAIAIHILNHLLPFTRYFSDRRALTVLSVVFVIALGWIVVSGTVQEPHPAKQWVAVVQQAPLSVVAALQEEGADDLVGRLRSRGIDVKSDSQSLQELASINQRHPFELLGIALATAGEGE